MYLYAHICTLIELIMLCCRRGRGGSGGRRVVRGTYCAVRYAPSCTVRTVRCALCSVLHVMCFVVCVVCTVLYCAVLHCTALHCTALQSPVP